MSIIRQTYEHFEFLIFDDGSTDESAEIIKGIKDSRIKLFSYPVNTGYVTHLNTGIKKSSGIFIARMDADDIADPERIKTQVHYLLNNPEIGLCGSQVEILDSSIDAGKVPIHDADIRIAMMSYCPIWHPTVMIRKNILTKYNILYDENYLYSEDYELWTRLAKVTKISNIDEKLLKYRIHKNQVSFKKNKIQTYHSYIIINNYLKSLGFRFKPELILNSFINNINNNFSNPSTYNNTVYVLSIIENQNNHIAIFDKKKLSLFFGILFTDKINNINQYNPCLISTILFNNNYYKTKVFDKIKLFAKCCLFWRVKK